MFRYIRAHCSHSSPRLRYPYGPPIPFAFHFDEMHLKIVGIYYFLIGDFFPINYADHCDRHSFRHYV
ncbi:hypothetical protein BVI2075_970022 [Burkholderia vietnamiensis]|nr:hypothetical protein BVI2075_970022 [Burkholderia vietnamiensis]